MVEHRDPELPERRQPSRQEVRQTLIERRIRQAVEEGHFDDLPHQGSRLPLEDDSAAGDWALAYGLMRDAGVAPDWIEADKEVRRLSDAIDVLLARAGRVGPLGRPRVRRDLDDLIAALEQAVFRVNAQAPTDRQHRRPPDAAALRRRLEAAFQA